MSQKRRTFHRAFGKLHYRKLFVIAVEGEKTEPQYFALFNQESIIQINCLKSHHSSPVHVLRKIEQYIKNETLKKSDEAWLVVDRDQWTEEQLEHLYTWSQKAENYGFALSNPKFEYWILLHFEDGTGIESSRECSERLKRYLINYNKSIDIRKITRAMILNAIRRAKLRDNPQCNKWPRTFGTNVYKLVENILALSSP